MEPTLPNGCVPVIDSTGTGWKPRCIEVVLFGDNLYFRRIAADDEGRRVMVCDRPDRPDEPWPTSARIVGQARWVGRWPDRALPAPCRAAPCVATRYC